MNRSWALLAALLPLLVLHLAGCCGKEVDPDAITQGDDPDAAAIKCPSLREAQQRFGLTLGGVYGGATLAEYRITPDPTDPASRPRVMVTPPNSTPCSQDIANRLEQACDLCANAPESCLELVGAILAQPTAVCAICGDQRCTVGAEDRTTCALDCRCGDGSCNAVFNENISSCPEDCAGACGDGFCASPREACTCDEGALNCLDCAPDCCLARCGDGFCDPDAREHEPEAETWCENDCGPGYCGDGTCGRTENSASCPRDCAFLVSRGDGLCQAPETCFNSPDDCRTGVCLNGICEGCEVWTCAADCQDVQFNCGDGACEGAETSFNCPDDCPVQLSCGDGVCDVRHGESFEACSPSCNQLAPELQEACYAECQTAPSDLCDGYCGHSENAFDGSCGDCVPCFSGAGTCIASESWCDLAAEGADAPRPAVFRCAEEGRCGAVPEVELCQGACTYTNEGAACTTCPARDQRTELPAQLCPSGYAPTCIGSDLLRTCGVDPGYSEDPACSIFRTVHCPSGCVDGACDPTPIISAISPRGLPVGEELTIQGPWLGGRGSVVFEPDIEATILAWSTTSVRLIAPEGTTGAFTLNNAEGGRAEGQVRVIASLYADSVSPNVGERGIDVTIRGFFFGDTPGAVTFAPGVAAPLRSWSDRLIEVTVPADALTGQLTVTTAGGESVNNLQFNVLPSIPTNIHLGALEGRPGAEIVLTGSGFGIGGEVLFWVPLPEFEQNDQNGFRATIVEWTPTAIRVIVPPPCGTTVGGFEGCSDYQATPVVVRTPDGRGVSAEPYTALPTITEMRVCGQSWQGAPYDIVEVLGAGFSNPSNSVRLTEVVFPGAFPGTFAARTSASSLLIAVPAAATSGPIELRWLDGLDQVQSWRSSQAFIVTPLPAWDRHPNLPLLPPDSPTAFCTDGVNTVVDCAGAALPQDGTRLDPPSELIEGTDTFTDLASDLTFTIPAPTMNRLAAQCYCRDLNLGGFTDWRLPFSTELMSLADYGLDAFPADASAFPGVAGSDAVGFWGLEHDAVISSETYFATVGGSTGLYGGSLYYDNRYAARCVRSAARTIPQPRYTTTTDAFVDQATGLEWTRTQQATNVGWAAAINACEGLALEGHDDWRLPSIKEVLTVADFSHSELIQVPFMNLTTYTNIWTSTPYHYVRPQQGADLAFAFVADGSTSLWTPRVSAVNTIGLAICVRDAE